MKAYIIYEVYNREYDNCLLLQAALKYKGIEADIIYKMDILKIKPSLERRILIIPNCYNDENFKYYYYASGCGNALIINLQYEQVLSNDENSLEHHKPVGRAAYLYNLCWGENFKNFLIATGVDAKRCLLFGALQLDFLKTFFSDYWIKREILLEKYGIDNNKEVSLFISSFAYADNEFVNRAYDNEYGKDKNFSFRKLSKDTREEIIDWFERYLAEGSNKIIIYRKHPMEKYNDRLLMLAQKYNKSFYLIDDYNIKQWIFISDRILNWYSTSAVECVVAKKSFEILRPIPIDKKKEVVLFNGSKFITTFEEFENLMNSSCKSFKYPFDINLINKMYLIDSSTSFDKLSKWIKNKSEMKLDEQYIDSNYLRNRKKYIYQRKLRIKYNIKKIYQKFYKILRFTITSKRIRAKYALEDWEFQANLPCDVYKKKIISEIVGNYYKEFE